MNTAKFGKELLVLCRDKENRYAEVENMLGSLSEDLLQDVVRYRDQVSES